MAEEPASLTAQKSDLVPAMRSMLLWLLFGQAAVTSPELYAWELYA